MFRLQSQTCPEIILNGFKTLVQQENDNSTYPILQSLFNTCTLPTSAHEVRVINTRVTLAITKLAVVNYPFATNFMAPLPAWPVKAACDAASDTISQLNTNEYDYLRAISSVYNTFKWPKCMNISDDETKSIYSKRWDYFYCNELVQPSLYSRNGVTDMFWPPVLWDQEETDRVCLTNYKLKPQYDWVLDQFGGRNPKHDFASLTNVIFTNGDYDPWIFGGVTEPLNDQTLVLIIEKGAHGLDLQLPRDDDLEALTDVRSKETAEIKMWISKYRDLDKKNNRQFKEEL